MLFRGVEGHANFEVLLEYKVFDCSPPYARSFFLDLHSYDGVRFVLCCGVVFC
jgi:hypothetical protein